MHIVEDLDGVNVVRAFLDEEKPILIIFASSGFVEGKYYPAESITLNGLEGLDSLISVCERLRSAFLERDIPKPPLPKLPTGGMKL